MADLNEDEFETSLDSLDTESNQVTEEVVEDILPEKYKGKSAKEIIAMHQEAEKLISKQGGEVGELRKVVDDFIKSQTSKESTTIESDFDEDEFYTDPKKAVARAIENNPDVKAAKQASVAMKRERVLSELGTKHPEFMETVQNADFVEWIKASKVRTELYARAESQFDFDSADELLSSWEERTKVNKQIAETADLDRKQQIKAASVTSKGNSEPVSKKIYRRSDIIDLMQKNPERYRALSDEILKAYSEGRVK